MGYPYKIEDETTRLLPDETCYTGTENGRLSDDQCSKPAIVCGETPDGFKPDPQVNEIEPQSLCSRIFPTGFKEEFIGLIKLSWPIMLTTLLDSSMRITATMFSGHLGKLELDAAAMGTSIVQAVANSVGYGLASTCDTLFSQSFGSANKLQVGIYLQTAVYVSSLACILSWGLLANTNSLLLALGQDTSVARYTEEYMYYSLPAILFGFLFQLGARYLQIQGFVITIIFFGIISNLINVGLQYILVYAVGFGLIGSASSQSVGYFALAVLTLLYTMVSGVYKTTWGGFSRKSLLDWGTFMKLGLYSILMICLEWWAFELGALLMGVLGETELGASSVLTSTWTIIASFPAGVGVAVAYRTGRYLGSGRPRHAITAARVGFAAAWMLAILMVVFTFALRAVLPYLFTSDLDVVFLSTELMPLLALFGFIASTKHVCAGIIRGTGNQAVGAITSFSSYFLVGLPVGIPLMFLTDLRAAGFWWGLNIGIALNTLSMFIIIYRIDWNVEAKKAQIRAKVQSALNEQSKHLTEGCRNTADEKSALLSNHVTETVIDETTKSTPPTYTGLDAYCTMEAEYKEPNLVVKEDGETKSYSEEYWRRLYFRRFLVILLCLTLLAFGIICRFLIFIPPPLEFDSTYNITETTPTNTTNWSTVYLENT